MAVKKRARKIMPFLFTVVLCAVSGLIVSCGTSVSKPAVKPQPSDPFGVKVVALTDKVNALEVQFTGLDSLIIPDDVSAIIEGFTAVKIGVAALDPEFAALDVEFVEADNVSSKELYSALKDTYASFKTELEDTETAAYVILDQEVRDLQEQVSLLEDALPALDTFIVPEQISELIAAFVAIKALDEETGLWCANLSMVISGLGDYAKQKTAPASIDRFEVAKGQYALLNAAIANVESGIYFRASQELDPLDTWLAGLNVKYNTLKAPRSVQETLVYVKGLAEVSEGVDELITLSNEIDAIIALLGEYAKQTEALTVVQRFETFKAKANSLQTKVAQAESEGYALFAAELNALDGEIIKINSQLDTFSFSTLPTDVLGLIANFAQVQSKVADLDPWYDDIETILAAAGPYTTQFTGPELVQQFTVAQADRSTLQNRVLAIEKVGFSVLNEEFAYLAGEIGKLKSKASDIAEQFSVITDTDVDGLIHALQSLAVADGDVFELGDAVAFIENIFDNIEAVQLTSSYLVPAKARFSTIKIDYTDLKNIDEAVVESLLDFADTTISRGYLAFDSAIQDLENKFVDLQLEFTSLHKDIADWIQQSDIKMNEFGVLLRRYDTVVREALIKNTPESFGTKLTLVTADFDEVYNLLIKRRPAEFGVDLEPQQKAGLNMLKARIDTLVEEAAILNSSTLKELSLAFVRLEEYEYDYLEEQIYKFNNARTTVSAVDIKELKSEFEKLDSFAAEPLFAELVHIYADSARYRPIREQFVVLEAKAGTL
ncbi:MAG: hypothetical protein LBO67_08850 [Spirochaetaceae bacterium]|jgi:predicted nuclease with TOPRIM domain|nr:hypothetical protein [Spirochaetaceae bacterium]